jgi:hypothetical protein
MGIDAPHATMIAALIAAAASFVSLLINLRAGKNGEMRAAHRATIAPYLEGLSEDIHEVVAGVVLVRKRRTNNQTDVTQWLAVSKAAGERLKVTRQKTTYILPGMGEALRELSLASDHVATYKDVSGTNADELVAAYQALADRLNKAIEASYRTGVPASFLQRLLLSASCARVRTEWARRPAKEA